MIFNIYNNKIIYRVKTHTVILPINNLIVNELINPLTRKKTALLNKNSQDEIISNLCQDVLCGKDRDRIINYYDKH
jgi:hypothetical protein